MENQSINPYSTDSEKMELNSSQQSQSVPNTSVATQIYPTVNQDQNPPQPYDAVNQSNLNTDVQTKSRSTTKIIIIIVTLVVALLLAALFIFLEIVY